LTSDGNINISNNSGDGSGQSNSSINSFIITIFERLNALMTKILTTTMTSTASSSSSSSTTTSTTTTTTPPEGECDQIFLIALSILYYQCSVKFIDIINTNSDLSCAIYYFLQTIVSETVTASRPVEFVSLLICAMDFVKPQSIATIYVQRSISFITQIDGITAPSSTHRKI
jgi:hypothetical protein